MATLTDRQSIAANVSVANVMSGKAQEFVQEPSLVRLFNTASAVGMFCTLIVGDEVVVEDQEINAQNRMPLVPDDFFAEAGGLQGDRIVVKYRNSTAGAITVFTRVEVIPA